MISRLGGSGRTSQLGRRSSTRGSSPPTTVVSPAAAARVLVSDSYQRAPLTSSILASSSWIWSSCRGWPARNDDGARRATSRSAGSVRCGTAPPDVVTLLGAGAQEGLELALRQHHHLAELLLAHPEDAGDEETDLVEAGAARHPLAVDELGGLNRSVLVDVPGPWLGSMAGATPECGGSGTDGRARSPRARRRVARGAGHDGS